MIDNGSITWTTERRRLGDLIPWPINPAQIKEAAAKRLIESLDEFGQVQTLAISPDNEIYDGHQRQLVWGAAQKYGQDYEVDVRVSSRKLTEDERKKLVIYLRKGAVGEFDFDILANNFELDDLLEWGFERSELDLDLWMPEPPEDPGAQMDKAEELREKWGVESGQLWQLGEHRLICGDCTDKAVVDVLMQGELAGAVVTDPPYGINREGIENDDPEGLRALFDGCLKNMPIENAVVIAFQSPRLEWIWLDATREAGHKLERLLWMYDENDQTKPWHYWLLCSQAIRITSLGKPDWAITKVHHDVYVIGLGREYRAGGISNEFYHPSVKPIGVVGDLITHTIGVIYDPFLGSGTTLVACERLGRKCRAVEISPAYCAVAIQRWVDMTGGEPILIDGV